MCRPLSVTMAECALSMGALVRFLSAVHLALCLPSCFMACTMSTSLMVDTYEEELDCIEVDFVVKLSCISKQ